MTPSLPKIRTPSASVLSNQSPLEARSKAQVKKRIEIDRLKIFFDILIRSLFFPYHAQ
jgi:hypothetical protein